MTNGHSLPIINCKELRKIQDSKKPHLIIDVRDLADYEAGHVEQSTHIPFNEIETNVPNLAHDKNEPVVVVGERPDQAQETFDHLTKAGYKQVQFLLGGFDEWCKPAAPDIDEVLEEIKEDEEFLGDKAHHEEEVDSENDNQPLL
jgi:rhodanese-related sulfurtransferase